MDAVIVETGPEPNCAVIWLHGLGADGHDFEPIVPMLRGSDDVALRFVFPHAPIRPVTINGGARMRAWYDISGFDLDRGQDERGIRDSRNLVSDYIAAERARGLGSERILLAGFSQGGAMTIATGLTYPERLGGLIVLSAYVPIADKIDAERSSAAAGLPVFQGHGTFDPVVPVALGEASRAWLEARGHPVTWHSYPMAHSVSIEEINDLKHWLAARLS